MDSDSRTPGQGVARLVVSRVPKLSLSMFQIETVQQIHENLNEDMIFYTVFDAQGFELMAPIALG